MAKVRNFANLMSAWLEYMQSSEAPVIYQKWSFISIVAGALERKVWLIKDHDTGWYANLYVFLVGPAGSGKSTVAETAVSFLQEVEGVDFLADDLNQTTLFHDLSQIGMRKRFQWNGEYYPHSAATIFSSEASETFVEQHRGGGVIKKLVSLYNGGPLNWSLKHGPKRSTRIDGQVPLLNPCINLLACSTPEWLITKCMSKTDAVGGFGSRILVVVSKESLKEKDEWQTANSIRDMKLRKRIIDDLKIINTMKGSYQSTDCFKESWKVCVSRFKAWQIEREKTGTLSDYSQRKMTQLYKVTMCLAASRRTELVLTGKDILDAWDLLAEIEPNMSELLGELEISPDSKAKKAIIDYMRRNERKQISRAELHRDFPTMWYDELEKAIKGLMAAGRFKILEATANRTLFQFIDF